VNAPVAMKLLLEDGTEMFGRAFGAAGSVGGEVVINTDNGHPASCCSCLT
jgi:carbamoylphosphate synthase small subunit